MIALVLVLLFCVADGCSVNQTSANWINDASLSTKSLSPSVPSLKIIRNHTASFRHAKHKNSTELSKHIWTLKNDNIDYSISWRVLSSNSPYNSSSKRCNLCLKEKFLIIYRPDLSSLNKRNELVSSCRHRNKALLRYAIYNDCNLYTKQKF